MRFLTLSIAMFALVGVAYVNLNTPSSAAVFNDDGVKTSAHAQH